MKIAVVPNLTKRQAKTCTEKTVSILKSCGCEIVLKTDLFDEDGSYKETFDTALASCDVFIAVGGDGTIIHTAKTAALFGKPTLGVNAGKLGFTAGVERTDLHLLPNLLTGKYKVEKRCMVSVAVHSKKEVSEYIALNDAVVSGELSKIIDYRMAVGKKQWYRYRADGFIVSTPTGSTAYSLSAGGPVIEPTMECLAYTPICPHSLFNRSVIFSSETKLKVKILENPGRMQLTIDGEQPVWLHPGDSLTFSIAERKADFIKLDSPDFYEVLNRKIIETKP